MTIWGKLLAAFVLTIIVWAIHEAIHAIPILLRLLRERRKP
jgi:hypothetical protein